MESLSRPFHTRKLSNASNFSGKNAYDGVFSGHRQKYAGVPATNVQDYREIFGNSQAASSIPVLDLSTFEKSSDASSLSLRSSKPDYSKIFGGFRDEDIAVSYEELFARDDASRLLRGLNPQSPQGYLNGTYSPKAYRAPSSTNSTSQDSDDLSEQSFDDLKQFNMSYHKINQRGKDGLDNGRTHVAKLHDVPGFTCFFNETAPPQKIEAQKQKSIGIDSRKESFDDKQLSESDIRSQHEDNLFKTFEINLKSPSASPINADNRKNYPKRSTANDTSESVPEEFTPPCFDEELDVNSAAATSAAALKKAIEKAQESIRIAKESVGRKKKGLRSFSSKTFKDSLKVEGKMQDVVANEEQKSNRKHGGTVVFQDFMEGEKLFVAKKVIDEINGKISESANRSAIPIQSSNGFKDNMVVSNSTQVEGEIESRTLDSAINHEFAARPFEVADAEKKNNATSVFEQENQRNNMSVGDYEGEIKLTKPTTGVLEESKPVEKALDSEASSRRPKDFLVDESYAKKLGDSEETVKVDTPRESNENKDEVELCNAHELVNGLHNLTMSQNVEDEKKASQESNQNHIELPKNAKQEEVLEQKHIEKVENAERHTSDDEASENESRSSSSSPETHKEEETSETFYDVLEMEMNETAQTCDIKVEESEVTLKDDYEMKQEDNHMGETNGKSVDEACDQEFVENSSIDDNDMEESDLIDNSMETTQEVADVARASCEFQAEDTAAMKAAYSSEEEELFEKTSIDQTASDDNEDEHEVKSDSDFEQNETEENDVRSESSSGTIHGVEIDTDESKKEYNIIDDEKTVFTEEGESNNIQLSHKEIPEIRSAVEIKASQSEIGETGPSKVEGKEQQRKIDEVNVIEREREKNRLAVDRAIREARERAFAEARERAERAAVEKATAEVRQRMMADVREKIAKASVGAKSTFERTSEQSKLRAERAAVERATAEARQRALEKAMSQKCVSEADVRVNKESSSSDLHNSSGTSSESALRSKAKLEKHNRIMERAAKALAEKEKRDLLAQKEQAERNRLAENLDADIKRWSSGKERNLRALLSTLHYILGPDSGWQPISLTEIITTSAVKKAYRKATLCVHPDKLQQRGASIQHKYICEKVFDLLKAAWNRFNSEES